MLRRDRRPEVEPRPPSAGSDPPGATGASAGAPVGSSSGASVGSSVGAPVGASVPVVTMAPSRPGFTPDASELDVRTRDVRDRLQLTQQERLAIRRHVAEKQVTVDESSVFDWETQAAQYPATGPAGAEILRLSFADGVWINCVLHRGDDGRLLGILNHYPVDIPPHERKSTLNVWVHPDHRGQGIATKMVLAALEQGWSIDLQQVAVTGPGLALTQSVARRVRRDVPDDGSAGSTSEVPVVALASAGPDPAGDEVERARDVWERLPFDDVGVRQVERYVAGMQATVDEARVLSWASQAVQYDPVGPPGIRASTAPLPRGTPVNRLLYRGSDGRLLGILNHYPVDVPPLERADSINVWVHPEHRGRGIAREMVLAALQRGWAIDVEHLRLTGSGLALTRSLVRRVIEAGGRQ